MNLLNRKFWNATHPEAPLTEYPVKALQFGEGNFLRAFIDWMIECSNRAGKFNGMVQLVQPLPHGTAELIESQQGLYTLVLRGMEHGAPVEKRQVIGCVKGCLVCDTQWADVVRTALLPTLEAVFSNTTEAGIEYKPEPFTPERAQITYPAKLASLLYARFRAGLPGLVVMPCELIDRNGSTLRECILRYADDWALGDGFRRWILEECGFLNTLVDRIVAGYPRAEAEAWCETFGYKDSLIDCGELFHLLVIEGDERYRRTIPFAEAGLNVIWTRDQTPYRSRKVRFLNGGHTSSVLAAYLAGFEFVDQMTSDPLFGSYLRRALFEEIFPTVALPEEEKRAFAESVIERFLNPFANHRLLSISLNSISKWRVRVLPSLLDYRRMNGKLPPVLTFSLAALLVFYQGGCDAAGGWHGTRADGAEYPIQDDPAKIAFLNSHTVAEILARNDFWGMDLTSIPGFADAVGKAFETIRRDGVAAAVKSLPEA